MGKLAMLIVAVVALAHRADAADEARYASATDAATQTLKVQQLSDRTIHFDVSVTGACAREASGVAVRHEGHSETDTDARGASYPAAEYRWEDGHGCARTIRIATDRSKARVVETSCETSGCPFSDGTMARQKDPTATQR